MCLHQPRHIKHKQSIDDDSCDALGLPVLLDAQLGKDGPIVEEASEAVEGTSPEEDCREHASSDGKEICQYFFFTINEEENKKSSWQRARKFGQTNYTYMRYKLFNLKNTYLYLYLTNLYTNALYSVYFVIDVYPSVFPKPCQSVTMHATQLFTDFVFA